MNICFAACKSVNLPSHAYDVVFLVYCLGFVPFKGFHESGDEYKLTWNTRVEIYWSEMGLNPSGFEWVLIGSPMKKNSPN